MQRSQSRCDLTRITAVVLENEAGDTKTIEIDKEAFPEGLPLYESAQADQGVSGTRIFYNNSAILAKTVNAFTKGCTKGDLNGNGIEDVGEWGGSEALAGEVGRSDLKRYYQAYLQHTYFFELHDGWIDGEIYHIRERRRLDGETLGVPVVYPEGADGFWQVCDRHQDVDYKAPKSRAGGDFTSPKYGWEEMTHHSQFKCVEVVTEEQYSNGGMTRASHPEVVFLPEAEPGLGRKVGTGTTIVRNGCPRIDDADRSVEINNWTVNSCSIVGAHADEVVLAPNPEYPTVECQALAFDDVTPGIHWVAVGFENFACDRAEAIGVGPNDYTRGCVNECAEKGVEACANFDPSAETGSGRFTCDDEGTSLFGRLECGCGRSYGGANCEIGCPGDNLFTSDDFSIETRQGIWACGRVVASGGELQGGPYTLSGYIPLAPVSGTLTSQDGRYRLEPR